MGCRHVQLWFKNCFLFPIVCACNMNALQWMEIDEMQSVWTLPQAWAKLDPAPTKEDLLSLMHILSGTIKVARARSMMEKNPRRTKIFMEKHE